jgi:hypothetical protein
VLFKISLLIWSRLYLDNGKPLSPLLDDNIESPRLVGMAVFNRDFSVDDDWLMRIHG